MEKVTILPLSSTLNLKFQNPPSRAPISSPFVVGYRNMNLMHAEWSILEPPFDAPFCILFYLSQHIKSCMIFRD